MQYAHHLHGTSSALVRGSSRTLTAHAAAQVFTNNPEIEAARTNEYEALWARCDAEMQIWNVEARRWAIERAELTEACVRIAKAFRVRRGAGGRAVCCCR